MSYNYIKHNNFFTLCFSLLFQHRCQVNYCRGKAKLAVFSLAKTCSQHIYCFFRIWFRSTLSKKNLQRSFNFLEFAKSLKILAVARDFVEGVLDQSAQQRHHFVTYNADLKLPLLIPDESWYPYSYSITNTLGPHSDAPGSKTKHPKVITDHASQYHQDALDMQPKQQTSNISSLTGQNHRVIKCRLAQRRHVYHQASITFSEIEKTIHKLGVNKFLPRH